MAATLGLPLASGEQLRADHVVLAASARDTFAMLHERGVFMEAKPFWSASASSIRRA